MSLGFSTNSLFGSNTGTGFNTGTSGSNLITYTTNPNTGQITGQIPPIKVSGTATTSNKVNWNNLIANLTSSLPGVLQGVAAIKNGPTPVYMPGNESTYNGSANTNLFWIIGAVLVVILLFFILKRK